MAELIIVAALAAVVIAALVVALVATQRSCAAQLEQARLERQELTLKLMSKSAAEYALAEHKMHTEPTPPRDRLMYEEPVGL